MSFEITYGGFSLGNGKATVSISKNTVFDETGLDKRGINHTWAIKGNLIESNAAQLQTAKEALELAFASGDEDLLLVEDGNTRASLLTAVCKGGTRVTSGPDFAGGEGGTWANRLEYTITVTGDIYDGDPVDTDLCIIKERTTYDIAQDGHTTRTVSGSLKAQNGISAKTKAEGRAPSLPAGYQRMGSRVDVNYADEDANYEYRDWEYWTALPVNVKEGGYSDTSTAENRGEIRFRRTGRFTGTGAYAAALASKISSINYRTQKEEITVNAYDGSVSFSYEYIDVLNSSDILFWEETVSLQPSGERRIVRAVLGIGEYPEEQVICNIPAKATQRGSAIGKTSYPAFPAKVYDISYLDIEASSEEKKSPKIGPMGALSEYGISWTYTFTMPIEASPPYDPTVP